SCLPFACLLSPETARGWQTGAGDRPEIDGGSTSQAAGSQGSVSSPGASNISMRSRRHFLCLIFPLAAFAQTDSRPVPACAQCHVQAKTQPATSMGQALETVEECRILMDHPVLTGVVGKYSYRIERKGSQSSYSVSDGVNTVTMPIRWAMGASFAIGQTYILDKDGELYESRVSYFRE